MEINLGVSTLVSYFGIVGSTPAFHLIMIDSH